MRSLANSKEDADRMDPLPAETLRLWPPVPLNYRLASYFFKVALLRISAVILVIETLISPTDIACSIGKQSTRTYGSPPMSRDTIFLPIQRTYLGSILQECTECHGLISSSSSVELPIVSCTCIETKISGALMHSNSIQCVG